VDYLFQKLTQTHLDSVFLIAQESLKEAWSKADYQTLLSHPQGENWGFFEGETLVGFLLVLHIQNQADLIAVVVKKEKRGKGLGFLLLEEFKKRIKPESVFLEVDKDNIPAVRLYLKAGFQVQGLRKKYYQGTRDAWSMKWSAQSAL